VFYLAAPQTHTKRPSVVIAARTNFNFFVPFELKGKGKGKSAVHPRTGYEGSEGE
jgi:hypothetical protein